MLWAACGEARLMHWWAVWPHQSCAGFPREGWMLEQTGSAKGNEYAGKWRAVCIFVNSWLIYISWYWLIIAHIWVQVLRCCKSCIYWLGERENTWLGWNPATPHFAINFCLCSDKNANTPLLPILLQIFQFKRFLNKIEGKCGQNIRTLWSVFLKLQNSRHQGFSLFLLRVLGFCGNSILMCETLKKRTSFGSVVCA